MSKSGVYASADLLDFTIGSLGHQSLHSNVLMCPPEEFKIVDVKNAFMKDHVGAIDGALARRQWAKLESIFSQLGLSVHIVEPVPGCEDMVFCANPCLVGVSASGNRICVPSQMRFPSRRREVPAVTKWFAAQGYEKCTLADPALFFEGGGDAIWHPGRALIWGGAGARTQAEVYPDISLIFGVPVLLLEIISDIYYHLDTCFCPLNETTVLVYRNAFSEKSLRLIESVFPSVIHADPMETWRYLACNAAAFFGTDVVLQKGALQTVREFENAGFRTWEVDLSEFLKSGGNVFCMKLAF